MTRAAAAALLLLATPALAEDGCRLAAQGSAAVAAVRDGRTLALADGRTVRLAGLEVTGAAAAALNGLVGRPLRLEAPSAEPDRYGRLVAFAYAGGEARSVQQMLLDQGLARVAARVGSKPCADVLLRAERAARAAQRGLWADPNFAPLSPDNGARLRAELGRFTIVQGKVLSVRDSGSTIYVNFGPRWTRDFSVIILRRNQRIFKDAGLEPKALEGRLIRVRGVLEQRRGPVIEADVPEQIELADEAMRNAQEMRP
ncbi:MAG TPA: thermonuclease family protein [Pseudolabrys sp.]|nr:thermonuclease family protein [Pseudolabrys sp.]